MSKKSIFKFFSLENQEMPQPILHMKHYPLVTGGNYMYAGWSVTEMYVVASGRVLNMFFPLPPTATFSLWSGKWITSHVGLFLCASSQHIIKQKKRKSIPVGNKCHACLMTTYIQYTWKKHRQTRPSLESYNLRCSPYWSESFWNNAFF